MNCLSTNHAIVPLYPHSVSLSSSPQFPHSNLNGTNITLPISIFPHSPSCASIQCEGIKHYKLPGTSHMVSDSSACRREGGVPDTHSTVLKWDNSSAVPTGGRCDSTDGGHCSWNGVLGDCLSFQPGWNKDN